MFLNAALINILILSVDQMALCNVNGVAYGILSFETSW